MAYKTAAEAAAEVRAAYKAKGWNRNAISVRAENYAGGSSIRVEIKSPAVDEHEAKAIAEDQERVRYCESSGEILSGGNRFVSVIYSRECRAAMGEPHATAVKKAHEALVARGAAGALEQVVPGVLLGNAHAVDPTSGRLWVDGQAGMHVGLGSEAALVDAGFHVELGLRKVARAKAEEAARAAELATAGPDVRHELQKLAIDDLLGIQEDRAGGEREEVLNEDFEQFRTEVAAAIAQAEEAAMKAAVLDAWSAGGAPAFVELDGFTADLQQIVIDANEAEVLRDGIAGVIEDVFEKDRAWVAEFGVRELAPGEMAARTAAYLAPGERNVDGAGTASGRTELETDAIQHGHGPMLKAEKLAARMEKAAAGLQKRIDQKRNPGIAHQNLTPRRARIIEGMRKDAEHLEGVQRVLRQLARAVSEGADAEASAPLRRASYATAAAVEKLVAHRHDRRGPPFPSWLHVKAAYEAKREPTDDELHRDLERSLLGFEAPGFFPTPATLADRLVAALDLRPGDRVLEPSAGKGDLVDALLRAQPYLGQVVAVERLHKLAEVLETRCQVRAWRRGESAVVTVLRDDFLAVQLQPFDAVAMNPPFERMQDRQHVLHALKLLKPGGRLAAIVSNSGAYGRNSTEFHDALSERCDEWSFEPLPAGSFTGKGAFRQTGAACELLVAVRKS